MSRSAETSPDIITTVTTTTAAGRVPGRGARTRSVVVALALLVLAVALGLVLTVGLMMVDSVQARDHQDLSRVELGVPLNWVVQDQGALDPPFPYRTSFFSPLENPTSFGRLAFLTDLGLATLVLTAGWWTVRRWRARAQEAQPNGNGPEPI
jgi:hypothetical protein